MKNTIEEIPAEDMNFLEWHPTAPLFLTGGKDFMIWMVNAGNGKVMNSFIGHDQDVLMAQFTKADGGKQIVSCSADKTVKLWHPNQGECIMTTRNGGDKKPYHDDEIQCFALHPSRPLIMTGGSEGSVYGAHYVTGEISGRISKHNDSVESVALSEELQMGVSAGIDSTIIIYELKGLTVRHRVTPIAYGGFTRVMFSTIKISA